jgi:hypothetical protein
MSSYTQADGEQLAEDDLLRRGELYRKYRARAGGPWILDHSKNNIKMRKDGLLSMEIPDDRCETAVRNRTESPLLSLRRRFRYTIWRFCMGGQYELWVRYTT